MIFKCDQKWIEKRIKESALFFTAMFLVLTPLAIYELYIDRHVLISYLVLACVVFSIFWFPYYYKMVRECSRYGEVEFNNEGLIFRDKKGEDIILYENMKAIRLKGKGPNIIELKYQLLESTFPRNIEGMDNMSKILSVLKEKAPEAKIEKIRWWETYI